MRIEKIDEKAYKAYLEEVGNYKFLQSYEQVIYSKNNNRNYYLLGMFDENNKLVKATFVLVVKYARFFKKAYINMYDFQDENIDEKFLRLSCKFLKKEGISLLYMTSSQSINTRDEEAKIIGCSDEQKALVNLVHSLGFKEAEYDEVTSYAYQYVKDIDNIGNEEELIASYKRNDRNKIRKSFKNGLSIVKATRNELKVFRSVFNKSATRQGFFEQDLKYFESYYDAYVDSSKMDFFICYLDGKAYFESRESELQTLKERLPKAKNIEEEERKITSLEEKMKSIEDIRDKKIPISCGLFVESGDEYVYFLGGNDLDYTKFLGAYFVQHGAMLEAMGRGLKKYNFFGTVGAFIKGKQDGVYNFKRRFNGKPEELGIFYKTLSSKYKLGKLIDKLMRR